jgi:hypothetical protein
VKEILTECRQRPGWITVSWDGKGADGKAIRDGRYAFEIRPKYPTGHPSLVVRGEFMADSLPPEIGDVRPLNGSTVRTGMPTISARILSDLTDIDPDQLKIKIDENTVNADTFDRRTGIFSFTPRTSLGEGVHIAIAYAQDWAGNYAPPQAVSFRVSFGEGDKRPLDREPPEVSDLQPSKGATVYTASPLLFARARDTASGIDENNIAVYVNGERVPSSVEYFIQGKSGKPWDWYSYHKAIVLFDPLLGEIRYMPMEPLKEGKSHFAIEVMDRAGNKSKYPRKSSEIPSDTLLPAGNPDAADPQGLAYVRSQDSLARSTRRDPRRPRQSGQRRSGGRAAI